MLASDGDRDRAVSTLNDALASGRLSQAEHSDRIETALSARTLGELGALTADLPVPDHPSPTRAHRTLALFSKVRRSGQLTLGAQMRVRAIFGVAVVDLTHASFRSREVLLRAGALFGKVVVVAPGNATVEDCGMGLLAKRDVQAGSPAAADGPHVRVGGLSVFGKVVVVRERG